MNNKKTNFTVVGVAASIVAFIRLILGTAVSLAVDGGDGGSNEHREMFFFIPIQQKD